MKKRKNIDYLFTTIITVSLMLIIYWLTELIGNGSPITLTIHYLGGLAIVLTGLVALFRELSIWEISTHRLIVYDSEVIAPKFSLSMMMLEAAWWITIAFFILFGLSFLPFFADWVKNIIGGPILLWLVMIISSLITLYLALSGHIFWQKIAYKIRN